MLGDDAIDITGAKPLIGSNCKFLRSAGSIVWTLVVNSGVYPSGNTRATAEAPMMVEPPAMFSTHVVQVTELDHEGNRSGHGLLQRQNRL